MKNEMEKYMKGTTTIGVVCSDGVVIGADTRATMGTFIANSDVRKVFKIDNTIGMPVALFLFMAIASALATFFIASFVVRPFLYDSSR